MFLNRFNNKHKLLKIETITEIFTNREIETALEEKNEISEEYNYNTNSKLINLVKYLWGIKNFFLGGLDFGLLFYLQRW